MAMAENKGTKLKSPTRYKRIVAKFGTSLVTGGGDLLNQDILCDLVRQVAQLHKQGLELIIVTSGAMASGRYKLGLTKSIKGIPFKQVLASVGQTHLMHV